jgi:glutamate-1-semialdehyde 2,1-aminomutase
MAYGSSWETVGVKPDLSAWSKAIGNGHPIAIVAGADSLRDAGARVFATGSFWFSAVPMAAALATIEIAQKERVIERMHAMGSMLRDGVAKQATAHGLRLRQTGPPQMPLMLFDDDPKVEMGMRWTSAAAKRGVYLHPWHNMFLCAAHGERDIRQALDATEEAFAEVARAR